jgi:glycosyltransferase involved in cell wall biosynthesis
MTTSDRPLFSLIVATYGRADVLRPLVASLLGQTFRDFEVIVADQNPDDRVVEFLEPIAAAGHLGAHLTLPQPNLSAARNAGIAAARGRFVAFPDDDCWYDADTLERAAAAFAADPGLDGLAARWVESPPERGDDPGPIPNAAMRCFRAGNVASITLVLRTEAVRAAGGFDSRIGVGLWYGSGEETDLVLALLANGARLAHTPDVRVHHPIASTSPPPTISRQVRLDRARARGTGAIYAKHRLPVWVVLRGLLAPLVALPGPTLAQGAATSLGRLEGMLRWHFTETAETSGRRGGRTSKDGRSA